MAIILLAEINGKNGLCKKLRRENNLLCENDFASMG